MQNLTKDEWTRVQAVFDRVVDLPVTERTTRIRAAKLPDGLTAALTELLAAADGDGVLDRVLPGGALDDEPGEYSSVAAGARIGGFVIDRLIGRGGMGEVYEAHRDAAGFTQRVALKLLRPEAVGRAELFDRERQLLAGLEHPGIARLIDGGIAPDGRPYMAMEYVEGRVLTDAVATLSLGDRLRLFLEVCEAVGYAHARLVVHRDLKPSNILVDGDGRVRLLDFGIAKLIDPGTAATDQTELLVTPAYAAPEQLEGATATTAADVYALGAILYDLLAGRGPWQHDASSVPAMIQRVLRENPPPPSRVASGSIPAARIRGDLDAIVGRAMRREPEQRYATVLALADDVRRHLAVQPVRARAGSTRYVFGRFVRRYRWAVAASVAAVLALLIGAGGIAWQARQARIERDGALAEAKRSEAINRMLTVMLRDTAAGAAGETLTVKQMLDETATKLVATLDHSEQSADLVVAMFDLFVNLEDSAGADALATRALARGIGSASAVGTARISMRAAEAAAAVNATDRMPPLIAVADRVFRTDRIKFRADKVELNLTKAQYLRRSGQQPAATALMLATLPEAEQVYVENHRDLLTMYNNTLVYLIELNRLDDMVSVVARAEALVARDGEQNSMQGLTITQLKALRLARLGRADEAEPILTQVVSRRRAAFGESAALAVDMLQLARAKMLLGKFADARDLLRVAEPMAAQKLSPTATPTLVMGLGLAEALAETGDTAGAERVIARLTPAVEKLPKPGVPTALLARAKAITRLAQGRSGDARAEVAKTRAILTGLGVPGIAFRADQARLEARIAKAGQAAISWWISARAWTHQRRTVRSLTPSTLAVSFSS